MGGKDDFEHNSVSNVMAVNLNVLCTLIKISISNDENSGLIITMHGH